MTAEQVLAELKKLGNEQTRKTFLRHGAKEPFYGVRIGDMKPIQKRINVDHDLALALFDSGVGDAQYFAGLIADPPKMTKPQLKKWAKTSAWQMVSEYMVAWVAAESGHGRELAMEWIDSKQESIAATGWNTYASLIGITADEDLDLDEIEKLLARVETEIHKALNRVKYTMNGFVIGVGCSVPPLTERAKKTATTIGDVEVDMGDTSCKVPDAMGYIKKVEGTTSHGRKKKMARC